MSRIVAGVNGLDMRILEAGDPANPCVLLLHGFPELAYSWRHVMPVLARAGYFVVAPDQRGYGGTTGWDDRYDGDVDSFRLSNLVIDMLALLSALGIKQVRAVVGHDFGASVASTAALARPDVFPAVVLMSAPFGGPPGLRPAGKDTVHADLLALPRPRKHYQWYYSTRSANAEMWAPPQGLHDFLRAYYHHKSADWPGNRPYALEGGPPRNSRNCRPTTSWMPDRTWRRPWRQRCRRSSKLQPAPGCRTKTFGYMWRSMRGPDSKEH